MENIEGNVTTIIKFAVMMITPYLCVSEAMQSQLIAVGVAIVGLILAYLDAKHNNTIFNQKEESDDRKIPDSC